MKRGVYKNCKQESSTCKNHIKIVGITSSMRDVNSCAKEDPLSLFYLKRALKAAEKAGAKTQLIDLRTLKINPCKGCYSTCPAQCRFSKKKMQCDCYPFKEDGIITSKGILPLGDAYDGLSKKEFLNGLKNKYPQDDMHIVYKALMEADGIIFASDTNFYGRPALLQNMLTRFTALDGGVEELWGDGKNLKNSIKYAKNPKAVYTQRLFGKWCAFINCSKEGDSVTPNLMKACTMMGLKIVPIGVAYRVNWYNDPTFRKDTPESKKDSYTLSLVDHIGSEIVKNAKTGSRKYGLSSTTV